ncbi:retron St85 family RNA-directed DNA polymerase [Parvibaculum sp.]|jgi:RNA-directed DNA polymerase|uniref:retron St85 family RNA-directed DNA polymerase n=1 Tax=Parvibaculum sp. TaxID=2024848 RepID=UPI000C68BF41|nr:retron St85 family RNA-directed DNA polymerase [Parvibaculum sp.]MAM94908.1 RNA-dependent DNA polymerase [Parvibaculum sp.]HCX68120.1 RNA-directed DNA polymerase [Rhodobiaceae bacterium]
MSQLLDKLSFETGMRANELRRIMYTAPNRYKIYSIPKRVGGFRSIAQPAREVKLLQRTLAKTFLTTLPTHAAATAYKPETSLRSNALPHAGRGPVLKLDFRDFFPSIRDRDWIAYCRQTGCLTEDEDIYLTSRLLFHRRKGESHLRLAIGAPTSPILSNILMYEFDVRVVETVVADGVTYTRYADDMTFSAQRTGNLTHVIRDVGRVLRDIQYPRLALNPEKTTLVTAKYGRRVTGLTLANDGRVTVGRDSKRKIRAAVYQAVNGRLDPEQMQVLTGMLAYVNAVEPEYLDVLRRKFGTQAILKIQRAPRGEKIRRRSPALAQNR